MRKRILFTFCLGAMACWAQTPDIPVSILAEPAMFDDGQDAMHSRLFRTTTARTQVDLAGWWEFASDPGDAGETRGYPARFPQPETRLWVPGTWNSVARYWNYVGVGWYRRRFDLPAGGNLRLHFGSVFYRAKVWLDGRLLGEHEGGYLPFWFTVSEAAKGAHTIVVRADNRLGAATVPKSNTDWFPFGGIDRPVYAEIVAPVFIERFHVIPSAITAARAELAVKVFVRNLGSAEAAKDVAFSVDGAALYSAKHRIAPGASELEFRAALDQPRMWSPAGPNLYSARLALGTDDQFTRFGVRQIRVEGVNILLNGERIKLRGVNRHEDHPDWGSASPPHMIRQDLEIIRRLGANAVRAHYPLPELFLDYCDQHGLLFMSEVPAWQQSAEQLANAEVQRKMLGNFEEMVARDMNHPSILTWSLGNEWPQPDRSYDVIRSLAERARPADRTRLFTFVTGGGRALRVHELVDVISVNWARYQWYDPFTVLDRAEGEKSIAELALLHERYPNKPVIMTEFGGAESQAGWHNWGNVKWSEEFQARNVEDSGRYALDQEWISGGCVWQFCDTRSAPERVLAGRLHGWNGKGVVDAYRSPKLAFYRLQQVFRQPGR
ncbi:MAG: glycoside hydrolase family 2 protein [Bryobacteraceae bacterium]